MSATDSHTLGLSSGWDTISRLKSFDINKPIQVTIVLDDNDVDCKELNLTGQTNESVEENRNVNTKETKTTQRKRFMKKVTKKLSRANPTGPNYNNKTPTYMNCNMELIEQSVNIVSSNYSHIPNAMPKGAPQALDMILFNVVDIFKFFSLTPDRPQHRISFERYLLDKFRKCYKNVVNYLIPLQRNSTFLNNFAMRITTVCKNCSIPVNNTQTRNLLLEMMKWCYDKSMEPLPPYNALRAPRADIHPIISNNKHLNHCNNTGTSESTERLFVSSLPEGEISNNINSELLNLYNSNNNENNGQLNEIGDCMYRETQRLPSHTVTETGLIQEKTHYESSNYSAVCTNIRHPKTNADLHINKIKNLPDNDVNRSQNLNNHQHAEVTRSSISRDSGFDVCDDFIMEHREPQTKNYNETSISNRNTVLLGFCNVCKTATHKMCKGCYKLYYCSFVCLKAEWPLHKFFCCN